jgi:hypothetical protein
VNFSARPRIILADIALVFSSNFAPGRTTVSSSPNLISITLAIYSFKLGSFINGLNLG